MVKLRISQLTRGNEKIQYHTTCGEEGLYLVLPEGKEIDLKEPAYDSHY